MNRSKQQIAELQNIAGLADRIDPLTAPSRGSSIWPFIGGCVAVVAANVLFGSES